MTEQKKNPGQFVIDLFGGGRKLSRRLNKHGIKLHHSTVIRWSLDKTSGGTGGHIPNKYHRALLDMAKEDGLTLTTEHFVYGG